MLAENNLINLPGEAYLFRSNEPLILDNPQTIWLVKSGSLALFAINLLDMLRLNGLQSKEQ